MGVAAGRLIRAFGYQGDNMNLPVASVDAALSFYENVLGFHVASRADAPLKSAVIARDEIEMRLVENGGDSTQDGCAFHVTGIDALLAEFQRNGLTKEGSAFSTEHRGGADWKVFFVVAPDGLCYWFGERQSD
jgi:catechol 2,3-dioxygenase-like lactoylglutathione lyase family enzyme